MQRPDRLQGTWIQDRGASARQVGQATALVGMPVQVQHGSRLLAGRGVAPPMPSDL